MQWSLMFVNEGYHEEEGYGCGGRPRVGFSLFNRQREQVGMAVLAA
jgi:hypothetical protein